MKAIVISALVALVLIAGCVGQTTTGATNCGTDANCLRTAEASCSLASGTMTSANMTVYEEIRGMKTGGCNIYFNFQQPALGNADCTVPQSVFTANATMDYCQYCQGTFIDLARSAGQC